jgi:hypothetical protein
MGKRDHHEVVILHTVNQEIGETAELVAAMGGVDGLGSLWKCAEVIERSLDFGLEILNKMAFSKA